MGKVIVGTSALPGADALLMKGAGIGWVRQGFPCPFAGSIGGELAEDYVRARDLAKLWSAKGMKIMGVSPGPGVMRYETDDSGITRHTWTRRLPEWMGELGSDELLESYRAVCDFLAKDLQGLVQMWQIANELDITIFAGPMGPRAAADMIAAGARGLKAADPSLVVGPNTAGSDRAYFLYGRLYGGACPEIDYCGVDGYRGTWAAGGPDDWAARVAELYDLTGAPVLVNEWGFSSAGGVMTDDEARSGVPVCRVRKWRHTWGPGHTPEGQAEYVRAALDAFRAQREALLGVFFYRWEDQETCWQCGAADCPAETAWGLVDREGKPKPAYHAFKEGAERLAAAPPEGAA